MRACLGAGLGTGLRAGLGTGVGVGQLLVCKAEYLAIQISPLLISLFHI